MALIPEANMFDLRLPVKVKELGPLGMTFDLHVTAINSSSAMMSDPTQTLRRGQALSMLITLPTGAAGEIVRLECRGRVLALDPIGCTSLVSIDKKKFLRARSSAAR
jgi:hypothetical protein